jgi:hypothetical protein
MPKQAPEPPAPIRLSDNTIWEGKFYNAGDPLPVASVEELTPNLRPLVVTGEPEAEDEEPNIPRGNYQHGVIYEMTEDGRLGRTLRRNVQRQIAQLEAENERAEWIEAEASGPEQPPSVAEDLQAEHENAIALAKAQMAADARRSDEISDAAAAAAELPRMYVKRGGRHYAPADKARLLPGEAVFIRQPDGHFECIGETDGHSQLPDLPIEI